MYILDATSSGVSVSRWSRLRLALDQYYFHIFYRKLKIDRDDEFIASLDSFMKQVIGNKYNFSIKDVLFKKVTEKQI